MNALFWETIDDETIAKAVRELSTSLVDTKNQDGSLFLSLLFATVAKRVEQGKIPHKATLRWSHKGVKISLTIDPAGFDPEPEDENQLKLPLESQKA